MPIGLPLPTRLDVVPESAAATEDENAALHDKATTESSVQENASKLPFDTTTQRVELVVKVRHQLILSRSFCCDVH
jgi:hypothetical protein